MPDNNTPGLNCRGCGTSQERCTPEDRCCSPCNTNKTLHHDWGRPAVTAGVMTPERLTWIRRAVTQWSLHTGDWRTIDIADLAGELLEHIPELTTQRDDARRIAMDSGIFQNIGGTAYLPDVHLNEEDKWRADPVGAVAWDAQVEQL